MTVVNSCSPPAMQLMCHLAVLGTLSNVTSSVRREPSLRINMAPMIAYTLPAMQLVCHLVIPETPSIDITHSVPAAVIQSPPQHETWTLPEGYVAYPDIGVAYKVHNHSVSWIDARYLCIQEGAQLASIDSVKKLEYVTGQRQSPGSTHVGIIRMYDDEMWVSVATGLPVSSIPWASDEPFGEQDCVMISGDGRGLVNHSCDVKSDYVCQLPFREKNIEDNIIMAN